MTALTLTVRDETTTGQVLRELELQLAATQVSAGDLIRARVEQEVRAHNAQQVLRPFSGLVEPSATEASLNRSRKPRRVDADAQVKVALEAFAHGRVLLLVDDRQVDELDEQVTVRPGSTISFLKLVPLVGG